MTINEQWDIGWGPYPERDGVGANSANGAYGGAVDAEYGQEQAGEPWVEYDPALMLDFLFLRVGQVGTSPSARHTQCTSSLLRPTPLLSVPHQSHPT